MEKLYKGVFWITDPEDIEITAVCYKIPVDSTGQIDTAFDKTTLNSRNNDNYNHKKLWESLDTKVTNNKGFDYYPRGRVEIRNKKAIIYANPTICTDAIREWIIKQFGLSQENGIELIRVIADHSFHYESYFDRI